MEENFGVILGQRETDYIAGSSPIEYKVVLPDGNWESYIPVNEKQKNPIETMACVSFSAVNSIETQEKQQTGIEVNYSDRWIALMSGTTTNGNYLWKVGDTVRNYGMVLESDFPYKQGMTWNEFYSITPEKKAELIAKGKQWLEKWDVKTEFVNNSIGIWTSAKEDLIKAIKQCPVQVVIPGHAVMDFRNEQDVLNYFDTYNPFKKKTPYSNIQTAYKYVLTPKSMTNSLIVKNGSEFGIFDPATSEDGLITLMRNRGIPVPLTPEGKLDWSKVKVDKTLV